MVCFANTTKILHAVNLFVLCGHEHIYFVYLFILFIFNSQWRESWKSASVVNAHLVDDPTIRQPGFALPRQQWSLLNRFLTGQGHCSACKKKWKLSDSDQWSKNAVLYNKLV